MTTTINTTILTDMLYRSVYGRIEFATFRNIRCGDQCKYAWPLSAESVARYMEQGKSDEEIYRIEIERMRCYGHDTKVDEKMGMLRSFRCLPVRNTLILDFLPWNRDERKLSSKTRITHRLDQLEAWDNSSGLRVVDDSVWGVRSSWTDVSLSSWSPW